MTKKKIFSWEMCSDEFFLKHALVAARGGVEPATFYTDKYHFTNHAPNFDNVNVPQL